LDCSRDDGVAKLLWGDFRTDLGVLKDLELDGKKVEGVQGMGRRCETHEDETAAGGRKPRLRTSLVD
jgi:hypothetical protein